jgi:hypothetical protein
MTTVVRPMAITQYIQIQFETIGVSLDCALEPKSKKDVLKRVWVHSALSICLGGYEVLRLTAVNVAGRKINVTTAITRISALSRRLENATSLESSAMLRMAALSA